jgi:hypothetical protein
LHCVFVFKEVFMSDFSHQRNQRLLAPAKAQPLLAPAKAQPILAPAKAQPILAPAKKAAALSQKADVDAKPVNQALAEATKNMKPTEQVGAKAVQANNNSDGKAPGDRPLDKAVKAADTPKAETKILEGAVKSATAAPNPTAKAEQLTQVVEAAAQSNDPTKALKAVAKTAVADPANVDAVAQGKTSPTANSTPDASPGPHTDSGSTSTADAGGKNAGPDFGTKVGGRFNALVNVWGDVQGASDAITKKDGPDLIRAPLNVLKGIFDIGSMGETEAKFLTSSLGSIYKQAGAVMHNLGSMGSSVSDTIQSFASKGAGGMLDDTLKFGRSGLGKLNSLGSWAAAETLGKTVGKDAVKATDPFLDIGKAARGTSKMNKFGAAANVLGAGSTMLDQWDNSSGQTRVGKEVSSFGAGVTNYAFNQGLPLVAVLDSLWGMGTKAFSTDETLQKTTIGTTLNQSWDTAAVATEGAVDYLTNGFDMSKVNTAGMEKKSQELRSGGGGYVMKEATQTGDALAGLYGGDAAEREATIEKNRSGENGVVAREAAGTGEALAGLYGGNAAYREATIEKNRAGENGVVAREATGTSDALAGLYSGNAPYREATIEKNRSGENGFVPQAASALGDGLANPGEVVDFYKNMIFGR